MQLVNHLWQDEYGLVLSAEAVTVGTIGVLGTVAGLGMASTAVDEELKEFATAIRRLDQSYGYVGHSSCKAFTAGSSYIQQDVETSVNELCADGEANIQSIHKTVETQRSKSQYPLPPVVDAPIDGAAGLPVKKNEIETQPTKKKSDSKKKKDKDE